MSVFELDDAQAATVEEALAFLDACDPQELALLDSDVSVSSDAQSWLAPFQELMAPLGFDTLILDHEDANTPKSNESSGETQASDDQHTDNASSLPARQVKHYKKTREANVKAVTKYRQRKRSEIAELRLLVKKLTAQLARLQQQNEDMVKKEKQEFKQEEVLEAAKLRKAKLLNRKLREALASQSDLNKTLQSQIQRQISDHYQELKLVLENHNVVPARAEEETPKLEEKPAAIMPECKEQTPPVVYGQTTHAQEGADLLYPTPMPKSKDTSMFTKNTFHRTTGGEILSYTARQITVSIPTDLVKKEPKLDNTLASAAAAWSFGHLGKFLWSRTLSSAIINVDHLIPKPQIDEPKDLKAELTANLAAFP
uniref:BZIP domain-containing protein n=1 Tax=Globisporangium ultimum (strain ATCC 200006 / CBS 805.95 / DAOM BR144) TaxID=431595 RepID=K3W8S5_GLOUD